MLTRRHLALVVILTVGAGAWALAPKSDTLTPEDLVAIQTLYAKYNWVIDAGDAPGFASTFTADGVFTIGAKGEGGTFAGHDAIAKFATGFHGGLGSHVRHWNTNLLITPAPEGAHGQVYLVLVDIGTKPASIVESAAYADQLTKTAEGWRFSRRSVVGDVAPAPRPQ